MKIRKVPFGYEILDGQVKINERESECIKDIFSEYIKDGSYSKLVKELNSRGVEFNATKAQWNKGRLHHILTNQKYLGDDTFPQIISKEIFDKAIALKNSRKVIMTEMSETLEYVREIIFCGKCGEPVMRRIGKKRLEHWACTNGCLFGKCLNDEKLSALIKTTIDNVNENPELLDVEKSEVITVKNAETLRLKNELLRIEERENPSYALGKKIVFQLAAAKFACCEEDKSVYTDYVRDEVKRAAQNGIDVKFLQDVVIKIKVFRKDKISVVFKNGAEITNTEEATTNECEDSYEDRRESAPCTGTK